MKNKKSLFLTSAVIIAAIPALFMQKGTKIIQTNAVSVPTTIDLNDTSDQDIKSYYASLTGKVTTELQGENLLKNLKGIIAKDVVYFSYGQAANIYTITDRDWANSPATTLHGAYNATTNIVANYSHSAEVSSNPYIHMLYCDYTVKDKTLYTGDGDVSTTTKSFDNEHAWSQTHGFADTGNKDKTGAGSDLHHLIAGTQYGNRTLHNNYSYGFVKTNDWDPTSKPYEHNNKRGTPLFTHSEDQQNKVFEPQDCDKGDIARALLYMVACYNNLDGSTPTQAIPALKLVEYVISENTTGFSSDNIEKGYYGVLSDILAWHKMDPVDEYEIHRNNLIYNNYQKNRNPFIDYPEWVDYIWGTSEYDPVSKTIARDTTPTGSVNLDVDVINGYKTGKQVTKIEITNQPTKTVYEQGDTLDTTGLVVTATYDDSSTEDVTSLCTYTVDMTKIGEQAVQVSYKGQNASFNITINKSTKVVSKIEVTSQPTKTVYNQGDTLDTTGLVITATYTDSTTKDVTSMCTYTVDMTAIGSQTVKVSYEGKTTSFNIIINKKSDKKGCFGAIETASLVVSLSALTLLILLIIRKRYILNK